MDQEKLIECVRSYEALYVTRHAKYNDTTFKNRIWKEIEGKINQPAIVCKKTWTNLRDSFRKAIRKRREEKSGQAAAKIKRWKFEDEMSFLLPFLQERESGTSLMIDSDNDEYNERDIKNDDGDNDTGDDSKDDESSAKNEEIANTDKRNRNEWNEKITKEKDFCKNCSIKKRMSETTAESETVMNYLLESKHDPNALATQQPDAMDSFFSSIAATVKNFSPYYQNRVKSQIFQIVTDLELKQIIQAEQQQSFLLPNSTSHRPSSAPAPASMTIPQYVQHAQQPHYIVPCTLRRSSPSQSP